MITRCASRGVDTPRVWHTRGVDLDLLLADLANRFDVERRRHELVRIDELAQVERTRVTFAARLLASPGRRVTLLVRGGERVAGRVLDAASTWVLVADGGSQSLVPLAAVTAAWPLGEGAARPDSVAARLTLGHVLREFARRRLETVIDHDAGTHRGVVVAAMADHVDVAVREGARAQRLVLSLSWSGLRRIRLAAPPL